MNNNSDATGNWVILCKASGKRQNKITLAKMSSKPVRGKQMFNSEKVK